MPTFLRKKFNFSLCFIILFGYLFALAVYKQYFYSDIAGNYVKNLYSISGDTVANLSKLTYGAIRVENIIEIVNVLQYDVKRQLPEEAKQIECILLKHASPPYQICLAAKDGNTQVLKGSLSWEIDIQAFIKQFFEDHKGAIFLDMGMNIGLHAIYAAIVNPGVHVVGVEPFPENVVTLHKSTHINKVQDRFTVLLAAVSNKRGPAMATGDYVGLRINDIKNTDKTFQVNAITANDLTPLVRGKKVLLKMDIEGSECHVFSNAHKLFADVDIPSIIMEIGPTRREGSCCFESMLKFLKDRNYKAFYFYDANTPLNFSKWNEWNFGVNIYFKKFYENAK